MTESRVTAPLFYCAALDGDEATLTGDEAAHVRAQRLRPGDVIALFDGLGLTAGGQIRAVGRHDVRVAVAQRRREPPPVPYIELHCAVPKGERIAVLIDMATQLGMNRFTPVRWQRGVVEPGARARERWCRIGVEACKQSRRLYVPDIAAPATPIESAERARLSGTLLIAAHPLHDARTAAAPGIRHAERIALFIGPEGGFTDAELDMLRRCGASFVRLGNAVLRIETAAVALIAAVNEARATQP